MEMKPSSQAACDKLLTRFYNFHDGVIRSVTLQYVEGGERTVELLIATRDSMATENESWVAVRILVRQVSSLAICERPRTTLQVLSQGLHLLATGDQVGVEFGGFDDQPDSLDELAASDGFAIGKEMEFRVEPY
ncbi:hypothetical protein [Blastopirellula retiformator]|uniref:Uncharacterized protein n=1 Tax=Blastopirellula retiformator TaxID=2527970 RepID=A0A5C5UVS5_9BACT|nr:hypothetical protein [Blastopirellula retiformator]TWT29647.1 hypothetical protein Enr8_48350 [Blastopirellula retiformator]